MPHLTSTTAGTTTTGLDMGLGIPGYAHPLVAPLEWGSSHAPAPRCTGRSST